MKSFDEFRDKVALVTGGGFGIGEEICYELGELGTQVVVADSKEHKPSEVAEKSVLTVVRRMPLRST